MKYPYLFLPFPLSASRITTIVLSSFCFLPVLPELALQRSGLSGSSSTRMTHGSWCQDLRPRVRYLARSRSDLWNCQSRKSRFQRSWFQRAVSGSNWIGPLICFLCWRINLMSWYPFVLLANLRCSRKAYLLLRTSWFLYGQNASASQKQTVDLPHPPYCLNLQAAPHISPRIFPKGPSSL